MSKKQQKSKKKKYNRATARIEKNKRERKQFLNIVGRMSKEDQQTFFGKVFDVKKTKDFKDRSWTPANIEVFGKFLQLEEDRRAQEEKNDEEVQEELDEFLNPKINNG